MSYLEKHVDGLESSYFDLGDGESGEIDASSAWGLQPGHTTAGCKQRAGRGRDEGYSLDLDERNWIAVDGAAVLRQM